VRGAQKHQTYLVGNLTAGSPGAMGVLRGLQMKFMQGGADAATAHLLALGALYRSIEQQAALLAYADNFQLLAYMALLCIPPVLLLRRMHKRTRGSPAAGGK